MMMAAEILAFPVPQAFEERHARREATEEEPLRRRESRREARTKRWERLADWAKHHARAARAANLMVLHNGFSALELDLPNGRRVHVRQAGAGFYVAVLGSGHRGRMSTEQLLDVLDALGREAG